MLQKILTGGLAVAIIGVIGFGIYDASRVPDAPEVIPLAVTDVPTQTATTMLTAVPPTEANIPTAAAIEVSTETTAEAGPRLLAQGAIGVPWQGNGTISTLGDFGLTLTTSSGEFYVELGPPTYWQAQDTTLAEGDTIAVDGFYNGEQVHPATITTNDGELLVLRAESGQPAWAGGNGQGGGGIGATQVQADDWLTLTGTISAVNNGQVTLNVDDGTMLMLQMGRPDFWQSQGITLNVNDPVEVLGFWSGEQFMAGDIRKTETGETIMLRDPNGRQLWAGPGRNGNGYRGGRDS